MPGLNWGATAAEQAVALPCDRLVSGRSVQADRAISIDASPDLVFDWLCQLRVAPYSYDMLDNFGRRSPRQRTATLSRLQVGQRFMGVFTLRSFIDGQHMTLKTKRVAVTYAVRPLQTGTRLHARVLFEAPPPIGRLAALGDLVMMRKQLLTLKELAEGEGCDRREKPDRTSIFEETT